MLKLSRKRPVEKEVENEKSKKSGQTKISKFFSRSILAPKEKEKCRPEAPEIVVDNEGEARLISTLFRVSSFLDSETDCWDTNNSDVLENVFQNNFAG